MTGHPRLEAKAPPFVGRARELAELGTHLASLRIGVGGAVLVAGEPGIGKTRLVERAVTAHAGRVVRGAGVAGEGIPAFWPWRQVLQECGTPETVAGPTRAWQDAQLLTDVLAGESLPAGATRYRLFEAVTATLAAAGRDGGVVVVLDDLQWADEGSVRLLQFVAERSPHLPVLLLCAYRDVELDEGHPLAAALADLARFGPQLALSGLSAGELDVLCRWFAPSAEPVPDEQRLGRTLHRQTGGNPFFAGEVLRLLPPGAPLDEAGLASAAATRGGVRAVVDRRLARLPQATCDVLAWAALDGLPLDVELLSAASGRPRPEVLVALDAAVAARVLTTDRRGQLAFSHDLLRESLLASLPLSERVQRHWALGRACAATAGGDAQRLSRAAAHLVAGAAAGDAEDAARCAGQAAEQALTALAYEDAAGWYERALSTRRAVVAGDRAESALLLSLGSARVEAGRLPAAREAFLAAASLAREHRDAEQLASAALGLGSGLDGFEVALFDQVQIDLLEQALAALPAHDSSLRARVQARLSVAVAFVESGERRRGLSEEAVAMARRLGDDDVCAYALAAWCDAVSGPDDVDRRAAAADEVVALATTRQLRPLELLGRRLTVMALLERGRLREAAREVDAFARVADVLRQPLYRWYVPLWRAALAMAVGDLEDAARLTEEAAQLGAAAGSGNAQTLVRVQRFVQLRCAGRFDEARALVGDLLAQLPDIAAPEALEGAALVADVLTGRPDRARRRADAVVARGLDRPRADSEWLPDLAQLAEAAVALRHQPLAGLVLEALQPYPELFVVEGIGAAVCGPVAHYLAGTARVLGREDESEHYEREAERLCSAAGLLLLPPPLADRPQFPAEPPDEPSAGLGREGDLWAITYGGVTVRVRDTKGLRDLAVLLRSPGRAVHVTELTGAPAGSTDEDLDATAVSAYRRRLADLEEDVSAAQADHDVERVSRLAAERDFLLSELTHGLGLGGRRRRTGDPVERARKAVTARIRDSIQRIALAHPALGRHLTNSIRTGTWCCYEPERPVRWRA